MVNEVNNLIFNVLITKQEVLLPGVGTLFLQRKPATINGSTISAPSYFVDFSSHKTACCIVDIIAETASVDVAQAEDIYLRWRDKVCTDDGVTIGGVGTLRGKTFICEPEFLAFINKDSAPVEITRSRRRHSRLILPISIVFAIVLALLLCLYFNLFNTSNNDIDNTADITINEVDNIDNTPAVIDTIIRDVQPIVETQTEDDSKWFESEDIRHRVVVGSYSTLENAERAARDIESANPDIYCSVFTLGKMYAVAVYGSSEHDDCVRFKQEHSQLFKQSWIYTPKRFKEGAVN